MAAVHVFGDTGGHGLQLFAALSEIGVDLERWEIPEGVSIVHLGDLIHRGPASNTIVAKVDKLIARNPGRWLQVLGNHEFQHIRDGIEFWSCSCSPETVETLQRWYDQGLARTAWAVEGIEPQRWTEGGRPRDQEGLVSSFLATHGGLTFPVWRNLGKPATASEAANLLEENAAWSARSVGEAMGINRYGIVGPVWARVAPEVYSFWEMSHRIEGESMPFGQLVGHSAPFDFSRKLWYANTPLSFRRDSKINEAERRTVAFVADSVIICMDPGYGVELDSITDPKQPYLSFDVEKREQ